jgi:hypothetical protein
MILLLDIMATKQAIQSKSTTATYEEPTANLSAANKVYDLPIPELSLRSNGSH